MFEPIQATWTFSSEELEAHWVVLSRRSSVHRKQGSHGLIAQVAVLVFCVIAAAMAPTAGLFVGLMCFVVVTLFWILIYQLSKIGNARFVRHWAQVIIAGSPETVEITQTHLRFGNTEGGIDTKIKWSRVADVGSASTSLTIWLNDFQGILLPKRVFHPSDVERILALWSSVKLERTSADVPEWLVRDAPEWLVRKDGPSSPP